MEKSSRWHYEGIRSQRQDEAKRTLREFQARFRIRGPQAGLVNQLTNEATSRKDDTNKSHPILLGPATVDSLLDEVPERLDYVKESKLPFDDMFFEFMEPVDGVLPGFDVPGKLCGLQLNKTGMLEEEDSYAVTAFYSIPNSGYASAEFLVFNDNPVLLEEGRLRLPRGNSVEVLCLERADAHEASERVKEEFGVQAINLSAGEFRAKIEQYRDQSGKTGLRVRRVKEILPYIREPTDQGEDLDYLSEGLEKQFGKINNLAINTINYINAQNVTLVPRTRKIKTITRSRKGREIVHNAEMPYHIVGIESRTQVVDQEREDNGSLRWRVYVRGHNRRIRDEKGSIKYVTWVHPHVKGPENAPWRDHRYAVLAGMLERERTMLSDYLPPKVA